MKPKPVPTDTHGTITRICGACKQPRTLAGGKAKRGKPFICRYCAPTKADD